MHLIKENYVPLNSHHADDFLKFADETVHFLHRRHVKFPDVEVDDVTALRFLQCGVDVVCGAFPLNR